MPTCSTHPDRGTRGVCTVCGRPYCEECLDSGGDHTVCIECSIADAGARVGRREGSAEIHQVAAPARAERKTSWIRLVAGVGMILVACEAATILLLQPPTVTPDAKLVEGPEQAQAIEAAGKLFLVQAAVEAHRQRTGGLPSELAELAPLLPESVFEDLERGEIAIDRRDDGAFTLRSTDSPVVIATAGSGAPAGDRR